MQPLMNSKNDTFDKCIIDILALDPCLECSCHAEKGA